MHNVGPLRDVVLRDDVVLAENTEIRAFRKGRQLDIRTDKNPIVLGVAQLDLGKLAPTAPFAGPGQGALATCHRFVSLAVIRCAWGAGRHC